MKEKPVTAARNVKNETMKLIAGTINSLQLEIMRVRCEISFLKSKESAELLKQIQESADNVFAQEYAPDGLWGGEFQTFMDQTAQELIQVSMEALSQKVLRLEQDALESAEIIKKQEE